MKKIGIVTLYHKNYNYGGQLQAYAMQKLFSTGGSRAQLVDFETQSDRYVLRRVRDLGLRRAMVHLGRKLAFKLFMKRNPAGGQYRLRLGRFDAFMDGMGHTRLYTEGTIGEADERFDAFVCGSDQVWNPGWWNGILLLTFAHKPKYAYAASIARPTLGRAEADLLGDALKDYRAVSVRERQAKELLERVCDREVELVLDPTLLLGREEWERLSNPPDYAGKYVLLYMLGTDWRMKKWLYGCCKSAGFAVIEIAFAKDIYYSARMKYADKFICDAGPKEWLGWVQNASYVFTDSFHGTVFSGIFEKRFWCFQNAQWKKGRDINSRLYSFLEISGLQGRMIREKDMEGFCMRQSEIDYGAVWRRLEACQKASLDFIKRITD